MLILTRKPQQTIFIGDDIKILVLDMSRYTVRIGIDAPKHVNIYREELLLRHQEELEAKDELFEWVSTD